MKRKALWLLVSALMALSLVIAACGPAETTPTAPETPTAPATGTTPAAPATPTQEKPQQETVAPGAEKPKYGGTRTIAITSDPVNFDNAEWNGFGGALGGTVYQKYITEDWTRGPAGSGVTNFAAGAGSIEDSYGPQLAESFETKDGITWVFKIRQGVHWQRIDTEAGRLMNGREMTADDIVASWNRLAQSPRSWGNISQPAVMKAATVEKTGPWEITVKTPVDPVTAFSWVTGGAGFLLVYPPEVAAKYGNLSNWRNAVGTGPFILRDYVPASQLLYTKNPNYWETDPVGPGKGNRLPYIDTYRELIIPDLSTRQAALRTGKIDSLDAVTADDWKNLMKTSPKLEYISYLSNQPWVIAMRRDKPDKPFSDVRVRQALMLATDFETIKKDYYGGNAEIDVYPVNKQIGSLYQPLSEMPESVQELFRYNPEKAKQLLKEAGYPNGFKTTLLVQSVAERIDEASIFKDMWAKVGIEVVLDVKETSVYTTINGRRSHEDMVYRSMFQTFTIQLFLSGLRGTSTFNSSYVNDPPGSIPFIEERYQKVQNLFRDTAGAYQAYRELKPFVLEQAFYIPRPTPYIYNVWWPWLKNYYGQGFLRYNWIDEDLKKTMGY